MPKIIFNPGVALDAYIFRMLREKGAITDDDRQNGRLQQEMQVRINDVIDKAMMDALPEDQLPKLGELLDRDASDAEIEEFFANSGADFEGTVQNAIEQFKADYLAGKVVLDAEKTTMTEGKA